MTATSTLVSSEAKAPSTNGPLVELAERLSAHERAIYLLLVAIALIPVWIVDRFPSQDGPVHLYVTYVLDRLREPDGDAFRALFAFNPYLEPNSTVYWILGGLYRFVPLLTAEKLMVTGYWLALAFAARYAVTAYGRDRALLAFLFLPFGFGYFLHFGFYNFSLAGVGFLLLFGFAVRRLERLTWPVLLAIGAGAFALVVTHLFGLMMFLAAFGLARIGVALRDRFEKADRRALPRLVGDGVKVAAVCAPAFVVVASFLIRHITDNSHPYDPVSTVHIVGVLALIEPIFALSRAELVAASPFIALVWTLAAATLLRVWREGRSALAWLPVLLPPLLLLGAYLLGTLQVKHFSVQGRLLPYIFFTMFLASASIGVPAWARRLIVPVVALAVFATTVERARFYRQADQRLASFVDAASAVAPGSTFVMVYSVGPEERRGPRSNGLTVDVMEHAWALLAIERDAVSLSANLLSPAQLGYFPVGYRVARDPFNDRPKPDAPDRLAWHEARIGRPVDYVLVWPSRTPTEEMAPAARARMTSVLAEASTRYETAADAPGGPLVLRRVSSGR